MAQRARILGLIAALGSVAAGSTGSSATAPAVRADMVAVPAGPFVMGHHHGQVDEKPPRRIRLAAFAIDRTEASGAAWKRCVKAGACTPARGAVRDRYPVTGVTWSQARDFCRWLGKRLPTEAQWEKAARGPDGRRFPWGDAMKPGMAACARKCGDGAGKLHPVDGPLGARGASPYGALHMAGNVEEWVADWYDEGYTRTAPAVDPPGPATRTYRVVRGGEYSQELEVMRASNRWWAPPDQSSAKRGFRCAR